MTDREIHDTLQKALDCDPGIDADQIVVTVHDNVVTLRGDVKNYRQKAAAERLAFGVPGVRAVANDVNTYTEDTRPTDTDSAHAALSALRENTVVPDERIAVSVSDRWVLLKGFVHSDYERTEAAHAVRELAGVRGVTNNLSLEPRRSALLAS